MSYSFSVKSSDKDAVKVLVEMEVDKIVAQQPIHEKDCAAIVANAHSVIDLAPEPGDIEEILISCNGYIGTDNGAIRVVSVGATATLRVRSA